MDRRSVDNDRMYICSKMIMKRFIKVLMACALFCLSSGHAFSMTPLQQNEVVAKINSAVSNMKSMRCTFTQTKYIALLSDRMESQGEMYYTQPGKLRWEYTNPYKYLFVFNGTKVYMGNQSKKDVVDTGTNKMFKEVARIMMNTVTGKVLTNASDFSVSVSDNTTSWVVTLVPKKKDLKQLFFKIEMSFNKSNLMITELNLIEKNNDRTTIKFTNVHTNTTINANLFAIP